MDSFVWGLIREDADLKVLLPFYSTVEEHRHLMCFAQIGLVWKSVSM